MDEAIVTWVAAINPAWILLLFPIVFGSVALQFWVEHRRQMKLERNPNRMDTDEYKQFNRKRFSK